MIRNLLPFIVVLPSLVYALITLWCAWKYFQEQGASGLELEIYSDSLPSDNSLPLKISILKPVKGMDGDSYDNFASFCCQEYAGEVQIVFVAASPDDPVIQVIRQLADDFTDHDIELVVNPALHGPNGKVSNLINAYTYAWHDIIIVSDSDVSVPPNYLQSVAAHFADPQTGLVTSLYRSSASRSVAAAVEALGFTAEMIPNVLVARQLEGMTFALGAAMAVRREALEAIGGFEALAGYLADDYQLGNRIHLAGWRVVLGSCFVESASMAGNLMTVLSRQLRWARTMRVSRPWGYFASGITQPFPAMVLAMLLASTPAVGVVAVALLYIMRGCVSTLLSRCFVRDGLLPRWLWLLPLRDMLAFFAWGLAFLGNRVEWRGSRFVLKPGGTIEEMV